MLSFHSSCPRTWRPKVGKLPQSQAEWLCQQRCRSESWMYLNSCAVLNPITNPFFLLWNAPLILKTMVFSNREPVGAITNPFFLLNPPNWPLLLLGRRDYWLLGAMGGARAPSPGGNRAWSDHVTAPGRAFCRPGKGPALSARGAGGAGGAQHRCGKGHGDG